SPQREAQSRKACYLGSQAAYQSISLVLDVRPLALNMHALVTGGGGFLGGYIVDALLARGDRVRSFGRGEYPQLSAQGVEVIRGDIRDSSALAAACTGVECVFHCAALPGVGTDRDAYDSVNRTGTELLLAVARRCDVRRF